MFKVPDRGLMSINANGAISAHGLGDLRQIVGISPMLARIRGILPRSRARLNLVTYIGEDGTKWEE